jgi:hypothetical protein
MARPTRLGVVLIAALCAAGCRPGGRLPRGDYAARDEPRAPLLPPERAAQVRDDALTRARVWREPMLPVHLANLAANPGGPDALGVDDEVSCRYEYRSSTGYSPKFRCVLPGGEVVKVKYGWNSREVRTEVAATRLLSALGFGADRMFVVRRVRCYGCPVYPHEKLSWLNALFADQGRSRRFDTVVVERNLPGHTLQVAEPGGWSFRELARVDPRQGGSGRTEVDALRLMAVFLANWDLKDSNQRLTCLPVEVAGRGSGPCAHPLAYMQDVGTTFGPHSLNVRAWRERPVWADAATCRVSMRGLPFDGATFDDTAISEGGRRFLGERLGALGAGQLADLFRAARFDQYPYGHAEDAAVDGWVGAFQHRVRQIVERPPCPEP